MKNTIEIETDLFWKMYNALRNAEGTLWSCNGATNPEYEDLTEEILETNQEVESVLNACQEIVKTLKEEA